MGNSMLLGIIDKIDSIVESIKDFFMSLFNLIPKIIYLLYTSLTCVLDVLQLFFRKLAGLDVYYVDGKAVSGDIVTNFIGGVLGINLNATDGVTFEYSALTTVFWAFIVFGIIIAFITTIVAIIKSHYSYNEKSAKGPMQYVYTAGKAVINMAAVPIIVMLGLYLSQSILTALDSITSTTSDNIATLYGDKVSLLEQIDTSQSATGLSDEKTYIYYDIFGFGGAIMYGTADPSDSDMKVPKKELALIGSKNQTFSGSVFRVAGYNANRARLGEIAPKSENWSGTKTGQLFNNATDSTVLAEMIDTAFACNLHLTGSMIMVYEGGAAGESTSVKYFTNFLTKRASSFSKFNVGLVWYYYDLWQFNFIVGFAAGIVCCTLFINIILGLITRLFMCIGLFLIAPPLFGLAPLDDGKAGKSWRENFMKQVLMAYGAVVGMNIFFLILPYMNEIDFFNIGIADYFARTLVIIVGLISIKAFIATVSGLVGGADANEIGGKMAEEVGSVAAKGTKMTVGAAKGAIGVAKFGARWATKKGREKNKETLKGMGRAVGGGIKHALGLKTEDEKDAERQQDFTQKNNFIEGLNGQDLSRDEVAARAVEQGYSLRDAENLANALDSSRDLAGNFRQDQARTAMSTLDRRFDAEHHRYTILGAAGYRADMAVTNARIKSRNDSIKLGQKSWKAFGDVTVGNVGTVMGESKAYKNFRDTMWKPRDYAKETADNTASMLGEMKDGRADMRQGFGTMHEDIGGVRGDLGGIRTDMNTGFADTNAQLSSANAHLDAIEQDTAKTRKATQRISRETDGLKARQNKIINENREAKKEFKKVKDKATVIIDEIKKK